MIKNVCAYVHTHMLRPAVPLCSQRIIIIPLCPYVDTLERLLCYIFSNCSIISANIFIVPLCPHADFFERLLSTFHCIHRSIMSEVFYRSIESLSGHYGTTAVSMFRWNRSLIQYSVIYKYMGTYLNSRFESWYEIS